MITTVFKNTINVDLGEFPVMTYADAMQRYGSDKPDLRVKMEFTETDRRDGRCRFQGVLPAPRTPRVAAWSALRVPGGARDTGGMSRGEIDAYTEFVKIYGAKGLAYIKVNDAAAGPGEASARWPGLQSPIVKNLHDAALTEILARTGAQNGDLIFFGADKAKVVNDAIGALRLKIGHSEFGRNNGLFDGRLASDVGGRLPDVRVRRRGPALHRHPPPVHRAQGRA